MGILINLLIRDKASFLWEREDDQERNREGFLIKPSFFVSGRLWTGRVSPRAGIMD